MRGIRKITILIITSFMAMGLIGCSEQILSIDDAKTKLEYNEKVSEMLLKSSEAFPNNSEKIFDEKIKEIRNDVESFFKSSKESENLKMKDSMKKELKDLETIYKALLKSSYDIESYIRLFDLEFITDEEKDSIKVLYEKNRNLIEKSAIEYIYDVNLNEVDALAATAVIVEKDMNSYEEINKFYGMNANKEYENIYKEKISEYKNIIDERYTLENSEIGYLDVGNKEEKEVIFEKVKEEIETELKSAGKLTFISNVMSQDVIMKKAGSIHIIKSYVDVEKGGSKERKEFVVKYDVSRDYYMLISVTV